VTHGTILAKRDGWLVLVEVIGESPTHYDVLYVDNRAAGVHRIPKESDDQKVFFQGTRPAVEWIESLQSKRQRLALVGKEKRA
jgi:hypothetical protein